MWRPENKSMPWSCVHTNGKRVVSHTYTHQTLQSVSLCCVEGALTCVTPVCEGQLGLVVGEPCPGTCDEWGPLNVSFRTPRIQVTALVKGHFGAQPFHRFLQLKQMETTLNKDRNRTQKKEALDCQASALALFPSHYSEKSDPRSGVGEDPLPRDSVSQAEEEDITRAGVSVSYMRGRIDSNPLPVDST
ncbi:unnamed protein product [Leuciscus chuanchicus]